MTYPAMTYDTNTKTVQYCSHCGWHHQDIEFVLKQNTKGLLLFICPLEKEEVYLGDVYE